MVKTVTFLIFFFTFPSIIFANTNDILFSSIISGDYDKIKSIFKEDVNFFLSNNINTDIYAKDENGSTLLILASFHGNEKIIKLLIDYESLVKFKRKSQELSVIEKILEKIALELKKEYVEHHTDDINSITKLINTIIFHHDAKMENELIDKLLYEYKPSNIHNVRYFIKQIKKAHIANDAIFKKYINNSYKNTFNNDKETALIVASKNGHYNILNMLLTTQNINMTNKDGNTALMLASKNGHMDIVIELIKRGASIDIKNNFGETASMLALKNNQTRIGQMIDGYKQSSFPKIYLFLNNITNIIF